VECRKGRNTPQHPRPSFAFLPLSVAPPPSVPPSASSPHHASSQRTHATSRMLEYVRVRVSVLRMRDSVDCQLSVANNINGTTDLSFVRKD
jgi:hypothetical protein